MIPLLLRLGIPAPVAKVALILLGVSLLIGAFVLWDRADDKAAVVGDRSEAKAEAVSQAREADERAERAVNQTRDGVEHANDRAREAAADSDDPLADGLRSLRAEAHRNRPPAGRAD